MVFGDGTHAVFLKFNAGNTENNKLIENIIPLKATSITIATSKTIPSVDVPASGFFRGESLTVALDLGMASKNITVNGFILEDTIVKNFTSDVSNQKSNTFTAIEIAQLIHSAVDSTGWAEHQAISELIILYDSKVGNDYIQRSATTIPFTYSARGGPNELDNTRVYKPSTFPENQYSQGLIGFIRSFNTTIDSTTIDISFDLQFEVAEVFPSGAGKTTDLIESLEG
jgi:hypothetical protein